MIPYGRQCLDDQDVAAVVRVLRSDRLTQGPEAARFEAAVAGYCRAGHAVAVSSGTAALHVACLALGLEPGRLLWTSALSFVASASCGRMCGADVDFVDIEPDTGNIDTDHLAEKLRRADRAGRLPDVLVAVHYAGQPCDLAEIGDLAARYGVAVVEDGCHALGASYDGLPIGSCRFSRACVFSFHPVKSITCGEGGMTVCNDPRLAQRMRRLACHGIRRFSSPQVPPWHYEVEELGWNYRLSDMHAALGRSQLGKLDGFVQARAELARRYRRLLADLPLSPLRTKTRRRSSHHLFPVLLAPELAQRKRELVEALAAAGVGVQVHYPPIHTHPYYRRLGFRRGDFPAAERFADAVLSLPLYPELRRREQDLVVQALRQAIDLTLTGGTS